jgi:Ca2+-binding RTX toxin-like protein
MLGLMGLLGAVLAGFMMDAVTSPDRDDTQDGADVPDEVEMGTGSLLDDPGAANDPEAGMARSDDLEGGPDAAVTLQGGAADDILTGDGNDDLIAGAEGDDLLGGRDGDDHIDGGAGQDWLRGGAGADRLAGAAGDDDLHGEDGDDRLTGGEGNDGLSGDLGRDLLEAGRGDDSLSGGDLADTLRGGTGDDALQGGAGDDRAAGGSGGDIVDGNAGHDTLWGARAGAADGQVDFLNGGEGDDVLHVGAGDYASGGEGADQFLLADINPGDPVAQITDFDRGEDALMLVYDAALHADPVVTIEEAAGDATVFLDGVPVAQVLGGAGMSVGDVVLRAA